MPRNTKDPAVRIADALEAIVDELTGTEGGNQLGDIVTRLDNLEVMTDNLAYLIDSVDILARAVDRISWNMGRG